MLNFEEANQTAQKILGINSSEVFAIPYRNDEAMLLGYAFENNDKFYGIASIERTTDNLPSIKDLMEKEKNEVSIFDSFMKAPYSARVRFQKTFGEFTKVYIDPETQKHYSYLDVFHGKSEIPSDAYARIKELYQDGKPVLWTHFFATKPAKELLISIMTECEKMEWVKKFNSYLEKHIRCTLNTTPTQESPIVLHFYGTDDVSFSKSLKDNNDVYELMKKIAAQGHDAVIESMFCC